MQYPCSNWNDSRVRWTLLQNLVQYVLSTKLMLIISIFEFKSRKCRYDDIWNLRPISTKSLESVHQTLRVYNSFAMFNNVHLTNISFHLNNLNVFGVRSVWQFRNLKCNASEWSGWQCIIMYRRRHRHDTKSNDNNLIYSNTHRPLVWMWMVCRL